VTRVELDGAELCTTDGVALVDDGKAHLLRITIGQPQDQR
jgi:hypothetical protein